MWFDLFLSYRMRFEFGRIASTISRDVVGFDCGCCCCCVFWQPVVFYDHFYDFGLHDQIAELIAARERTGVWCRSSVTIFHANFDGYVAQVGDDLIMKVGKLDWNPSKENNLVGTWEKFLDKGAEYQLWERKPVV